MKLSKSQRVNVIRDIASRLEAEDWTSIDLILKQFGMPTSDEWSGTPHAYVVTMIGDATDDDLTELGQHFGMSVGGTDIALTVAAETPYWVEGQLKAFISHQTAHKVEAANLQAALQHYGISGFVAHSDITPTVEWQIEIETALSTCDVLIALIYPDFVQSHWCDQEVGYALGRGVPVFTIKCGADPHGFVSRFQAFVGTGKLPWQIANEVFEAALHHKKLQKRMADIAIDLFVKSGSFATAKTRVAYLNELKVWDPSYSARILKAVDDNSQISGSWGVPAEVRALVEKWK